GTDVVGNPNWDVVLIADYEDLDALALSLVDNPALFDKLPVELQSALTALKALPAEQQDAAAQQIATDAGTGTYGPEIQKIAEHLAHGAAQDTGHDASGHDASGHADATAAH
ncbi:hypothetical protein QN345_04135, partial [Cryobacterium sp. 10I1]|uniref:hypothetical protein n=1 Tax=Cryobacterium sp. 10I1 TaxID=3048578 RepID=UPI002B235A89